MLSPNCSNHFGTQQNSSIITHSEDQAESLFFLYVLTPVTSLDLVHHDSSMSSRCSRQGTMEPLSPASQASTRVSPSRVTPHEVKVTQDWALDLGNQYQAKRARVENIIRGMASSPPSSHGIFRHEGQTNKTTSLEMLEDRQENQRNQRLLQHHDHLCSSRTNTEDGRRLREELLTMQKLLGQLHSRFIQIFENPVESKLDISEEACSMGVTGKDDSHSTGNNSDLETKTSTEVGIDPHSECNKMPLDRSNLGWLKNKLVEFTNSNPDKDKLLANMLKYEISRAINFSVDSIFKNISHTFFKSPQLPIEDSDKEGTEDEAVVLSSHMPASSSSHFNSMLQLPLHSEGLIGQQPAIQTEALTLVVQKPVSMTGPCSLNLEVKHSLHANQTPLPYNQPAPQQDDHTILHLKNNCPQQDAFQALHLGTPSTGMPTPKEVHLQCDPVQVRSKVCSKPLGSSQAHQPEARSHHLVLDCLGVPDVKMECGSLERTVKRTSYVLNEGLTTQHLKKAKLMFFYTRYPSSNILKTFFPDVQLSRCILSQLIKWFSNFREFYYIQMEKFARQAQVQGVASVRNLTVGRDSELFRALNMHYNKANDFQVPDRFLEVAEITLQEFYIAISLARDSDPSWKKAIYKVICKLDSDVPAEFRSPITT
uniref:Prospero domain-containing protein n=1 Tax=Esox lucius TaxID=8010 RepID=A0A3P8ZI85_ESOLU